MGMRRWKMSKKAYLFLFFVLFAIIFYIEVLTYTINTRDWSLPQLQKEDRGGEERLSVLLVADPQIIGEKNERPFFGLFTRWDADRYIERNYMLALYHVKPHVVAFMGDLFDEGISAEDAEYRRYAQRFKNIFHIPRNADPSPIEYIYIPGDNDVGGEGVEAVNAVKLKWFNQTFGDYKKELTLHRRGVDVQFIKMNLFLPEEYQNPTKGMEHLVHGDQPNFRILLSHISILPFRTNAVQTILDKFRPQVAFSAHSHHSSYFQLEEQLLTRISHHKFLLGDRKLQEQWKIPYGKQQMIIEEPSPNQEALMLQNSDRITLQLNRDVRTVHEISVPTCSYRNGVANTGFGAFYLYKNGTLEYTVLWLPSRLNQLFVYAALGFLIKIVLLLWISFRVVTYLFLNRLRFSTF